MLSVKEKVLWRRIGTPNRGRFPDKNLKIGDVARLVGMSAAALRVGAAWGGCSLPAPGARKGEEHQAASFGIIERLES